LFITQAREFDASTQLLPSHLVQAMDFCIVAQFLGANQETPSESLDGVVQVGLHGPCRMQSDGNFVVSFGFYKAACLSLTMELYCVALRSKVAVLLRSFSVPLFEPILPRKRPAPSQQLPQQQPSPPAPPSKTATLSPLLLEAAHRNGWSKERLRLSCAFDYCGIKDDYNHQYAIAMENQAVTLDMVGVLNSQDLRECGISRVGDRVRIQRRWAGAVKRALETFP